MVWSSAFDDSRRFRRDDSHERHLLWDRAGRGPNQTTLARVQTGQVAARALSATPWIAFRVVGRVKSSVSRLPSVHAAFGSGSMSHYPAFAPVDRLRQPA